MKRVSLKTMAVQLTAVVLINGPKTKPGELLSNCTDLHDLNNPYDQFVLCIFCISNLSYDFKQRHLHA